MFISVPCPSYMIQKNEGCRGSGSPRAGACFVRASSGLGYLVLTHRVLSEAPSGEQWSGRRSLFLTLGVASCQVVGGGAQSLRQTPSRFGPKACHLGFSAFLLSSQTPLSALSGLPSGCTIWGFARAGRKGATSQPGLRTTGCLPVSGRRPLLEVA